MNINNCTPINRFRFISYFLLSIVTVGDYLTFTTVTYASSSHSNEDDWDTDPNYSGESSNRPLLSQHEQQDIQIGLTNPLSSRPPFSHTPSHPIRQIKIPSNLEPFFRDRTYQPRHQVQSSTPSGSHLPVSSKTSTEETPSGVTIAQEREAQPSAPVLVVKATPQHQSLYILTPVDPNLEVNVDLQTSNVSHSFSAAMATGSNIEQLEKEERDRLSIRRIFPVETSINPINRNSWHPNRIQSVDNTYDLEPSMAQPTTMNSASLHDVNNSNPVIPQEQPVASRLAFVERIQDSTMQVNTLLTMGLEANEDNLAAYFLEPEELYERIVNNFHGKKLILNRISFQDPRSLLIFEALKYTHSVKVLLLNEALMRSNDYFTLSHNLAYNHSLKQLHLKLASWPKDVLQILGMGIRNNTTLKHLILEPRKAITPSEFTAFYDLISQNQSLKVITWPQLKERNVWQFFKSLVSFEEQADLTSILIHLTETNAPAALHYASILSQEISIPQDLDQAEFYFEKADQLGHRVAGYELGKLKEKVKAYQEAYDWYFVSAEKGYAPAQYKIAEFFRGGWPKENPYDSKANEDYGYKQAYEWNQKAASQNYGKALYRLGRSHEAGRGVEVSLDQAAHYFYQATQCGHVDAFLALGALYNNPAYSGYNPDNGNYYLIWSLRFDETKGRATLMLNNNN